MIGTNKPDAVETVTSMLEDLAQGLHWQPSRPEADAVTWEGWQAIDEHERSLGEPHGRPRVKLVQLAELMAAGRGSRVS